MASGVPRSACRAAGLTRARPFAPRQPMFATSRWFSNTSDTSDPPFPVPPEPKVVETSADPRPRWSFTPPLTKAPFSLSEPKDPKRSEWKSNEDPAVLDRFYEVFLGPKGPDMLPEELKWQAITHKSFDQGRRGFNDRLAYLGTSILVLDFLLHCLQRLERTGVSFIVEGWRAWNASIQGTFTNTAPTGRQAVALELTKDIIAQAPTGLPADPYGREPFSHPSLDGINNLAQTQPKNIVHHQAMHKLALEVGMMRVVRWKPRLVSTHTLPPLIPDLLGSGNIPIGWRC